MTKIIINTLVKNIKGILEVISLPVKKNYDTDKRAFDTPVLNCSKQQ